MFYMCMMYVDFRTFFSLQVSSIRENTLVTD